MAWPGNESKIHGEMKVVKEWGKDNRVSFVVVGNQLDNYGTPTTTMASWNKYGIGVMGGPVSGSPPNTVYNSIYTGNTSANTNYYKLHPNPFTNIYISAPSRFNLGHNMTLTETPYFWAWFRQWRWGLLGKHELHVVWFPDHVGHDRRQELWQYAAV